MPLASDMPLANAMPLAMTKKDYTAILKYYKMSYAGLSLREMKKTAEDILAKKLCRCIKKVGNKTTIKKQKAIAICVTNVLKRKHLKTFKFKCNKGYRLLPKKGTRIMKTRLNLGL